LFFYDTVLPFKASFELAILSGYSMTLLAYNYSMTQLFNDIVFLRHCSSF